MDDFIDRVGPERLWVAVVALFTATIALGAILFPQRVYVEFIWQYYWGPIVADAHEWSCVAWNGGTPVECGPDTTGPTASPGYTFVSYAGYIPTLILLLVGIVFLLRRLDLERYRAAFYGLFPFMLFGGALRTVEDANASAFRATGEMAIAFPWSGFLISPIIYFTVFLIALFSLVVSVWLDRRDYVEGYERPLFALGSTALLVTIGYLGYVTATEDFATFQPGIAIVTLGGATAITGLTWYALERFAPDLNRGTRYMGIVIIWAHTVDGVANVVGLDWATKFGLPYNLTPKHPINEAIVNVTASVLPASVLEVTGAAWPFLLLKVAAAVFIISIFDERIFEDSPRFAFVLLVTVVAVGLGPGTRDMLRATFGV